MAVADRLSTGVLQVIKRRGLMLAWLCITAIGRCYTPDMLRLAGLAILSGGVAEGMLFGCSRLAGPIGPCGPTSMAGFLGLFGHMPAAVVQALFGYDFTDASVFAVNAGMFALFFFVAGRHVQPNRPSSAA